MTEDDFRDVLLAFEGVEEGAHMGHPDFRLQGRIFASLMADGVRANVKLAPEEQAAFVEEAPRHVHAGRRRLGPPGLDDDPVACGEGVGRPRRLRPRVAGGRRRRHPASPRAAAAHRRQPVGRLRLTAFGMRHEASSVRH